MENMDKILANHGFAVGSWYDSDCIELQKMNYSEVLESLILEFGDLENEYLKTEEFKEDLVEYFYENGIRFLKLEE